MHLSWSDNSDNENGFAIERAKGEASFSEIATVTADIGEFIDEDVEPESTYSYRVRAFNDFGYSGYSNVSTKEIPSEPVVDDATQTGNGPQDPGGGTSVSSPDPSGDSGSGTSSGLTESPEGTDLLSTLIGNHSDPGYHIFMSDIGLHVLSASGKGLGGQADSLRFAYSSTDSNAMVTLYVPAIASTTAQAEASLQFRQTVDPNAPYVAVTIDQDNQASGTWRTSPGATSQSTPTSESVTATYLRLRSDDTEFTLEASPNGLDWDNLAVESLNLSYPYLVGFGISTQHNNGASFGGFEILESNVDLLPPSFSEYGPEPAFTLASNRQIGSYYNYDAAVGIHTLIADGVGFESVDDELAFPNWTASSSVRIAAKIGAFYPDSSGARFGLMVRSGTESDDAFAAIALNGNNQVEALWRTQDGARISTDRGGSLPTESYLALEYADGVATLLYSRDGANWSTYLQKSVSLGEDFHVGPTLGSGNGFSAGAIEITGLY